MDNLGSIFAGIHAALCAQSRDATMDADWLLGYDKAHELADKKLVELDGNEISFSHQFTEIMYILGKWKRPTEPYPMPVVRPVHPKKKMPDLKWSWGVYGEHVHYFEPMNWELVRSQNPMPVMWFDGPISPWKGLEYLGIDITDLREMAQNECPCSEMTYTAFVPIAVLTTDSKGKYLNNKYRHLIEDGRSVPMATDMISDGDWNRTMNGWFERTLATPKHDETDAEHLGKPLPVTERIGNIHRAILGSGYNSGILPSDGGNSLKYVMIPLDNGDKIICAAWEWSNK